MLLVIVHGVRCDTPGLRFSRARRTGEILESTGDARCMNPSSLSGALRPEDGRQTH